MPHDRTKEKDIFAVLRPRLTKALVGFGPDVPEGWQESNLKMVRRPDPSDFPLPDLVLFALRNVLGFPWRGPEEKVRWSVFCAFNGVLVSFEMRKFGFTICTDAEVNLDRICGQLRVAVKHVEDWLEPVAREQAAKGNVTIANRHHEFDTRYRFFRKLADRSYGRAEKKPRQKPKSKDEDLLSAAFGDLLPGWNATMRANREGFYYSTAMVDAFFSRLEHHLVLLRAFCGRPLKDDDLSAFLSMKWDKKLIALLDVTEPGMQKFYSDLKRIKERVRNPFAHGGVENDGGSLFVHIPTVGALPANFTQIRHSVRFNFIPIKKDDHGSACAAFDAFDAAMRTGPHAGAYSFVEAGIDPSFDAEHLVTYKELASAPTQEREEWFQYWHNENDRHANMDY